jgi:hypothetical protein
MHLKRISNSFHPLVIVVVTEISYMFASSDMLSDYSVVVILPHANCHPIITLRASPENGQRDATGDEAAGQGTADIGRPDRLSQELV